MASERREFVVKRFANGRTRVYDILCDGEAAATYNNTHFRGDILIYDYMLAGYGDNFTMIRTAVLALLSNDSVDSLSVFPRGVITVVLKKGASMDFDGEKLDQSLIDSTADNPDFFFRMADLDEYKKQ